MCKQLQIMPFYSEIKKLKYFWDPPPPPPPQKKAQGYARS